MSKTFNSCLPRICRYKNTFKGDRAGYTLTLCRLKYYTAKFTRIPYNKRMILAVDVSYKDDAAIVGGVLFHDWVDDKPAKELLISCSVPGNYLPGQFYRRELPCIAALLEHIADPLDAILIDGYVYLGRSREPGLGKHLRDMLDNDVVVIGVAKTPFKDTPKSCELLRGKSRTPLYVTAEGMSLEQAKLLVRNMHGKDRIPTLLKRADRICRQAAAA